MNIIKPIISISLTFTLCSCANLLTSTKSINLKNSSTAIDIKQRVIIRGDKGICAEPSPDAFSGLGMSNGLSLKSTSGQSANLTNSLSESAAFIGLRTQSIQLLRDSMYRLCEGYNSGAISQEDFATMQRRYQNTMMGLIAIEQLTGPVVASQALLMSKTSAKAGAANTETLASEEKKLSEAKDKSLTAMTELDQAKENENTLSNNLNNTKKELEDAKKQDKPDQEKINGLRIKIDELTTQYKQAKIAVDDKKRRLQSAEELVTNITKRINNLDSNVDTSSSSDGTIKDISKNSLEINDTLAKTVADIVTSVNHSYSIDRCISFMTSLINNPDKIKALTNVEESLKNTTDLVDMDKISPLAILKTGLGACSSIINNRPQSSNEKTNENDSAQTPPKTEKPKTTT